MIRTLVLTRHPAFLGLASACGRSALCTSFKKASSPSSEHSHCLLARQTSVRRCLSIKAVQHVELYDQPELYDKAFSFREFEEEVQFLQVMLESADTDGDKSFLELGCGPARHASMLQLKTKGQAVALDNSKAMLAYAGKVASVLGAAVQFQHGDMQTFQLQKPVNMAFMILGTFAHLLDTEAALRCLHSTHAALKPGGILVLELVHPADAFDGSLLEPADWDEAGQEPEEGKPGELAVQYGKAGDHFDPIEQVVRRTVTICKGDKAGKLQQVVSEEVPQRVFTYQELKLLAMLSNFSIMRTFGEMDLKSSLSDEEAARMVIVLKRIQAQS